MSFARLAAVAGADSSVARAAREIVGDAARAGSPLDAARRVKRRLAEQGFRDDPMAFTLDAMLERRGGNCLGLTLFLGAALLEAGHDVSFFLRRNPFDDVHVAGEEHFAVLCDPESGVDEDSRLPDALDCTSRFRFVPVEHASLALRAQSGEERPFEPTTLHDEDVDPEWSPDAECLVPLSFEALSSTVWIDRAKMLLRSLPLRTTGARDEGRTIRRATRHILRALRDWPENREGWADLWRTARLRRSPSFVRLAAIARERYARIGGDDSLFAFTRFQMTGDARHLEEALARFPSYAEAYFDKHVSLASARGDLAQARRGIAVAAWLVAESEILDLERFYRERAEVIASAFSEPELEELLASFSRTTPDAARSREPA
jgi:hypothetical protein